MGMFDTVYKLCECGEMASEQTKQFRCELLDIRLDDLDYLASEFDTRELHELYAIARTLAFHCDACGASFRIPAENHERRELAKKLFGAA